MSGSVSTEVELGGEVLKGLQTLRRSTDREKTAGHPAAKSHILGIRKLCKPHSSRVD